MQQHLVVPTPQAMLAAMILQRVRREAARAGKWKCPVCKERTISANADTCLGCKPISEKE